MSEKTPSSNPLALLRQLLAGLAVAAVFLLALEGGARLLPLERWERDSPDIAHPLFVHGAGGATGYFVTNPHFAGIMSLQRVTLHKPVGTRRVFILGGSAALGWPGDSETSFSGYMRRALDGVMPGRYEIINVAAMSYGSHRVLDLLADVLRMEPDLIIIWSGNNEYLEHNTLSRFARSEAMRPMQRLLRHSSLYRSVRLALVLAAPKLFVQPEGGDLTDPRFAPQVRRGSLGRSGDRDAQVLRDYRANLQTMADMIKESGAAGMICTVPVNIADWVPADLPPDLADPVTAARWRESFLSALQSLDQGDAKEAIAVLRETLALTPDYAFGYFILGDAWRRLEHLPEALQSFKAALAHDPRPIRALPAFAEAVREIALAKGLVLVDLEAEFLEWSGVHLPGLDLFLDYVHPNETGHKLAAFAVLIALHEHLDPTLPLVEVAARLGEDEWLAHYPVHEAERNYVMGMTFLNKGDLARAEQVFLQAAAANPDFPEPVCNLGHIREQQGNLPAARDYYARAVNLDPGTTCNLNLARILYRLGDRSGAQEAAERLLLQGVENRDLDSLMEKISTMEDASAEASQPHKRTVDVVDHKPPLAPGFDRKGQGGKGADRAVGQKVEW